MKRLMVFLSAALAVTGSSVWAQYNTSPIEKMCYGGRNQMGLHLCVCDQSFISGMSALILGNSVVLHGPGKLMDCLVWADEMNGVPGGGVGVPAHPPQAPVALPKAPIQTPAYTSVPALPPSAGPCGAAFNACNAAQQPECMNSFNTCTTARIDQARATAVQNQLLAPDVAARLTALSPSPSSERIEDATPSAPAQPAPPAAPEGDPQILYNNWNTGGCDLTATARFTLKDPSYLQRLETWIDWSKASGNAIQAQLRSGSATTSGLSLTFTRGQCHPSMPDWCYGTAQVGQTLPAGGVTITSSEGVLCENTGSGHNGYMKAIGFPVQDQAPSSAGTLDSAAKVEARLRSKPFNFRFSCDVDAVIGNLMCDMTYSANYTPATNTWTVCGKNRTHPGTCWDYDNAPASGPYFSAWGIVLKVAPDGSMTREGVTHGQAEIDGTLPFRRPSRTGSLPPLSYKPPKLGMPGNRTGTGGPRYYVD